VLRSVCICMCVCDENIYKVFKYIVSQSIAHLCISQECLNENCMIISRDYHNCEY